MFNEEIPVNEWLKKIKYVKLGRNNVYRAKILDKVEVFIVFTFHLAHWKTAERPKGSTSLH